MSPLRGSIRKPCSGTCGAPLTTTGSNGRRWRGSADRPNQSRVYNPALDRAARGAADWDVPPDCRFPLDGRTRRTAGWWGAIAASCSSEEFRDLPWRPPASKTQRSRYAVTVRAREWRLRCDRVINGGERSAPVAAARPASLRVPQVSPPLGVAAGRARVANMVAGCGLATTERTISVLRRTTSSSPPRRSAIPGWPTTPSRNGSLTRRQNQFRR